MFPTKAQFLVADDDALTGLYSRRPMLRTSPRPRSDGASTRIPTQVLAEAQRQLTDYLAGDRHEFDLPTRLRGDDAQKRVWALLETIPFGETVTYGELAVTLADGTTAQEVGQAVGRNRRASSCRATAWSDATASSPDTRAG